MSSNRETTPLETLTHFVGTLDAPFACGGTLELKSVSKSPLIFYRPVPQELQTQANASVAALPLASQDIERLHEAAVPSPHGVNGETVFDPAYRDARQIAIENFAMNFDPLSAKHGILSAISQLSVTNTSVGLYAELYKLNSYSSGGFFKSHRDTPKGLNHVGSIVVCLPSKFTGGELVVRHHGEEVEFDFKDASEGDEVAWAFLFSDCEHEVLPVLNGTRVTLAYDVYHQKEQPLFDITVNLSESKLYHALANVVKSQKKSLKIGIAFRHAYPMETAKNNRSYLKELPSRLKGFDAELYFTAKSLGLETSFVAIYEPDDEDWAREIDEQYRDSDDSEEEDADNEVPLTSDDFSIGNTEEDWDAGETRLLTSEGAGYDRSVTWIKSIGESFVSGTYLAHGNQVSGNYSIELPSERLETDATLLIEASIEHVYASAALVITIM